MFYGTTPVTQVAVLRKAFNARYPFVELKHFYGVRQVILNKAMGEFRSGAYLADVLMTDVSYGSLFIKEGISPSLYDAGTSNATCAVLTMKADSGTRCIC